MFRKIRVFLAVIVFALITLLFLDFTGTLHKLFGFLAKVQLVPAVLAVNAAVIIALAILTLLFGRIYCSVICPLGVMQDGISWFSKRRKSKRAKPFKYSKPIVWLRWTMLSLFAGLLIFAANYASIIEPYSIFGRIASNLFAPVYKLGNNVFASLAERVDSYAFYSVDVWIKSGIVFGTAAILLIILVVLSWKKGRIYCNTICPVGTFLGLISRFSLFKPMINQEKCNSCGVCALKCKSQCINSKEHKIDYSRCVTCFDCMDTCNKQALKYRFALVSTSNSNESNIIDSSKRNFLAIAGILATTAIVKAQEKIQESAVDGGFAEIEKKKAVKRNIQPVPPGAESLKNLHSKCTACQLCISACPNSVLRPSSKIETLMQPEMQYERGFCRPECTECSQVCPTGAIKQITREAKSSLQIGRAVWVRENCRVTTDEITCTSCEQHCPSGAVSLVAIDPDKPRGLRIPVIDVERCIGCGACEYLCPARPFAAIYVEGNEKQITV